MEASVKQSSEKFIWDRISQVELNASFIHSQYRTLLKRLHTEIDSLKSANRDLQFQLILLHHANQNAISVTKTEAFRTNKANNRLGQSLQSNSHATEKDSSTEASCQRLKKSQREDSEIVRKVVGNNQSSTFSATEAADSNIGDSDENRQKNTTRETSHYELDCSGEFSLKFRCQHCQRFTLVRLGSLEPQTELKATFKENGYSLENSFLNSNRAEDFYLTAFSSNRKKGNSPTNSLFRLRPHSLSQSDNVDQNFEVKCEPETTQCPTPIQNRPSLGQTPSLAQNPILCQNVQANLKPIVHKTYVLSIEDTDPGSITRKVHKTIMWSKRQTGDLETEPPCILPPLQNWQESRCTSDVKKIQPSTSTPILPEIVTKK